jgi:CDP-diacylglycerol--serine O-phosphatidyltransferase
MRHIPNFLTCCNLLAGVAGILYMLESPLWLEQPFQISNILFPAYFVWVACVFDFVDGFAARALKVHSAIGKELDSLADVVSFGVLPALLMYKLIEVSSSYAYLPYIGLSIAIFSALRLAKFNIDETQTDSFKGLPVPANALFITGLPLLTRFSWSEIIFTPVGLSLITVAFSLLLVSRIDLFALKFKDFTWKSNKLRFTFLLLAVLLLALFKFTAFPLIIILYILLSLGNAALNKSN